ncbi:hypothetical protein [Paraburkholderia hayleyella]|uniref:hypothetical protein n=1 Tax=Paraburkholderia hayleyella TaxID=2152889 RepID=UPI001291625B|nr:hypothetical protein [Paraburkholderia hayleyella]
MTRKISGLNKDRNKTRSHTIKLGNADIDGVMEINPNHPNHGKKLRGKKETLGTLLNRRIENNKSRAQKYADTITDGLENRLNHPYAKPFIYTVGILALRQIALFLVDDQVKPLINRAAIAFAFAAGLELLIDRKTGRRFTEALHKKIISPPSSQSESDEYHEPEVFMSLPRPENLEANQEVFPASVNQSGTTAAGQSS